jgi:mycobactin peptide synthetase MbtE
LVGFFINILVLRNDLRGNPTLREVCRRAREMALEAYAHQDLPFDQVVDAVSPVRTLARNPLFSVVVHVREQLPENRVIDHGPDGDTTVTVLEPTFDAAHADLSLNFFAREDGGGYRGHVIYRPELYSRDTAQRFVGWLGRVVTAFAEQPDLTVRDLEIGAPGEQQRIVEEWGGGGLFVLDQALRPVPVGVVGDVYTAGGPLTAAHWNRAALTATRLVAHPCGAPGARLHRTGDRARWSSEGVLELVGSDERATQPPARAVDQSGEPPTTDTERALATLLGEVLDVEVTGRYDDFFSLGGDSILAVQLAARARDAGLTLTARMVFEQPTLHDLAAAVDDKAAVAATDGAADTAHAPMSASGLSPDELAALTASWSASRGDAP